MAFAGLADPAIEAITTALERRGYRVVRSFDLQSALSQQVEHCSCPHHGTDKCTCQYVVLLAYPPTAKAGGAPWVLSAHSYGLATEVALHHDGLTDPDERFAITSALVEAAMLPAPDQLVIEDRAGISKLKLSPGAGAATGH